MRFWNLESDAAGQTESVIDIDGEIVAEKGWWTPDGACVAKEFRAALAQCGPVTVHINSPGGDVLAAAEIYSALKEHSLNGYGRVRVIITSLAASAASIIAMAGDEILMHPVAYMMIHNPWTMAAGDAREMRSTAKMLDEIREGLISAYQQRTGKSRDDLVKMLDRTTWMSAGTAVEEGFADGLYGVDAGKAVAASLAKPCLMAMDAHGAEELAERLRMIAAARKKAEEEKDPDEEEPDEEETEEPEEEPDEEEAGEAEEEEPEEDPEKDPDEDKPEETARAEVIERAWIALRASIAANH